MERLVEGGVITKEVGEFVCKVIDMLYESYSDFNEDGAVTFTTHLAMATQRALQDEAVEELDEDTWEELKKESNFGEANVVCDKIQEQIGREHV